MRKLLLIAACILACTTASRADVFSTSFEAPTFQPGQLAGQGGFTGSTVGQVESGIANTGTQAVVLIQAAISGSSPIAFRLRSRPYPAASSRYKSPRCSLRM